MLPLAERVLGGERLALARALTEVENDTATGRRLLEELFPYTGNAHLIGITGSPGTGKSSLVNQIARLFSKRVGIIAVDPTSPFTGGALLGDRVRMADLAGKQNVFIRSMASRGALGGLALRTASAVDMMDAAGYDWILIETVGAGQSEVEIARLAHTVVVVEAPGMGDEIQASKAGILEIADILVVNKADLPGAENTARALQAMLDLGRKSARFHTGHHIFETDAENSPEKHPLQSADPWSVPVLLTEASSGRGVPNVLAAIEEHANTLRSADLWRLREAQRLATGIENRILFQLSQKVKESLPNGSWDIIVKKVMSRKLSPDEAAKRLIESSAVIAGK